MTDDRTPTLNLQLPHQDNTLLEDVARLRAAITAIETAILARVPSTEKGANSGVATLDSGGKVPSSQLPSYIDDVLEYANLAAFPGTGETGKIYVAIDTGSTYRWSGSAYVPLPTAYTLPTASASVLGGVKVGAGLNIASGVLSVAAGSGQAFTAYDITPSTGGQTSFAVPGGYVPGAIIVGLNGSTMVGGGDDYTATDGVNVVLTTGISSPSKLQVFVFSTFDVANAVAKAGDTLTGALNDAAHVSVASAATVNLGAVNGNRAIITGTTTITSLGTALAGVARTVTFAGALTLTHNATSLILPGVASITTAAGDTAEFESLGAGNWRCTWYQRASGATVVAVPISAGGTGATTAAAALAAFGGRPNIAPVSVINTNTTANKFTTYAMIASLTLTLPATPVAGDWVTFSNRSGTLTCVIARNGQSIMGLAEDMTVNIANLVGTLVFADATRGWIFA